jgi:glycosyltransferase involved in cell wall biosynthesis
MIGVSKNNIFIRDKKMTNVPFFSIITPSFNQGQYIQQNIESVLNQNYPKFEHIIMDGGSTDTTISILQKYPHLIWKSEPDKGQSDAINKGILSSKGEWIVWVNSDDYLLPNALQIMADTIKSNPDSHFICSNVIKVNVNGERISKHSSSYSPYKITFWWRTNLRLFSPGSLFTRHLFDEIGLFNPDFHYMMDYDFFLRAHRKFDFHYVDADLVAFRKHSEQKGSQGNHLFFREGVEASIQYWKNENWLLFFMFFFFRHQILGSLFFIDGLKLIQSECYRAGFKGVIQGIIRNPFAIFRREHFGFWLHLTLGSKRYEAIKAMFLNN